MCSSQGARLAASSAPRPNDTNRRAIPWTRVGNLVVGRSGFTLSALSDGRGLAVGGNSATGLQSSVEVYDPTTGSWTTASPMHTARANHSATVLADGRVLVAGGVVAKGGATNEAEIYDPATSVWTRVDSLTTRATTTHRPSWPTAGCSSLAGSRPGATTPRKEGGGVRPGRRPMGCRRFDDGRAWSPCGGAPG